MDTSLLEEFVKNKKPDIGFLGITELISGYIFSTATFLAFTGTAFFTGTGIAFFIGTGIAFFTGTLLAFFTGTEIAFFLIA